MTCFKEITRAESFQSYKNYKHAAHGMLAACDPKDTFGAKRNAVILMQMRFDGTLGFIGGLVDPDDNSIVDSLNRECVEEVALDLDKVKFSDENYISSHISHEHKVIVHFFAKKISLEELHEIEKKAVLEALEWGRETLGVIRAPLSLHSVGDQNRIFKAFMKNNFAGNAREQLILGLKKISIVSQETLQVLLAGIEV